MVILGFLLFFGFRVYWMGGDGGFTLVTLAHENPHNRKDHLSRLGPSPQWEGDRHIGSNFGK